MASVCVTKPWNPNVRARTSEGIDVAMMMMVMSCHRTPSATVLTRFHFSYDLALEFFVLSIDSIGCRTIYIFSRYIFVYILS